MVYAVRRAPFFYDIPLVSLSQCNSIVARCEPERSFFFFTTGDFSRTLSSRTAHGSSSGAYIYLYTQS